MLSQTINVMKHNIIKTENYLVVVDDSEIKEGDYGFITSAVMSYDAMLKEWNQPLGSKITAHLPLNNSPVLEGVDLLPPLEQEDGVEKLVNNYVQELIECKSVKESERTWISAICHQSITKVKEKYKFTEKDIKTPTHFEFEMEKQFEYRETTNNSITGFTSLPYPTNEVKPRTTTNSQGQTQLVGRYIFN